MFEAKATYLASAALAGVLAVALQAPAQAQGSNEQYDAGHQRRIQSHATSQQSMTQRPQQSMTQRQSMTQQRVGDQQRFTDRQRLGDEHRNMARNERDMRYTREGRDRNMARNERDMRYTREGRDMRYAREGSVTGREDLRGYNGRERFAGRDRGVDVYGRERGRTDVYARNRGTDIYARNRGTDIYANRGTGTDFYASTATTAPGAVGPERVRDRYHVVGYTYPPGAYYGSGWNGTYAPGGWNATYYGPSYGYPADYGYYNGPFNPVGAAVGGALDIANAATFGLFAPTYPY